MTPFLIDLIKVNEMRDVCYIEPYAGGAGAALNLLLSHSVQSIIINDANPCIYSFWKFVTSENERFIEKIEEIDVSLKEWEEQKNILRNSTISFELGFATFFLSRTNRSGILNAGPIGGMTLKRQEEAKYKINCRFNKVDLIRRIKEIGKFRKQIWAKNLDAIALLKEVQDLPNVLVYLDPPYFVKGKSLYLNSYTANDHHELAAFLRQAKFPWLLSYDNVEEIRNIYRDFDLYQFNLGYTAQTAKLGNELLTHSKDVQFPGSMEIRRPKAQNIPINPLASND